MDIYGQDIYEIPNETTASESCDVPVVSATAPADPTDGELWWDIDEAFTPPSLDLALIMYEDGDDIYVCKAATGSEETDAVWQIKKAIMDGETTTVLWCDGDAEFDNVATSLAIVKALSYS